MKKILFALSGLFSLILLSPYGENIFFRAEMQWIHILFLSTSLSFFLTPLMRWIAFKLRILDMPAGRKIHSEPTPLLGGLAVYTGVALPLLWNRSLDNEGLAILLGGTALLAVGIINDKKEISASIRLLIQIAISAFVIKAGVSLTIFSENTVLGFSINYFLSFLWIVGITNSMNFFDGMDGLAAGLSVITAFFMGVVAFTGGQPVLGLMAIAVLGASLGFLPYNFRVKGPATIFLGESGSTFLGFFLSSLAIKSEWSENNPLVSLTVPILIFAIFIYDTIYITVSRIIEGKVRNVKEWIDYVGKDHLHHRMDALLRGKKKSVVLIYFIAIALGLTALLIERATTETAILLLLQAVLILGIITILEREGNKRMRS